MTKTHPNNLQKHVQRDAKLHAAFTYLKHVFLSHIEETMNKKDISTKYIEQKMGFAPGAVNTILRNKENVPNPTLRTLARIFVALDEPFNVVITHAPDDSPKGKLTGIPEPKSK